MLARAGHPAWIRLVGEVDDETLNRFLASCDVLCLPSRERTEAFGLVLLEAMRYGKALVVSDLAGSGVTWVARQGQNALLVAPDDPPAWSAALTSLAEHPAQRELMGKLGRERYLREFDIGIVARRTAVLYALTANVQPDESSTLARIGAATAIPSEDPEGRKLSAERLLVVIPELNEADCIGAVIAQARAHPGVDVLVIDDGSSDDTGAIALVNGASVLRAPLWQGAWGAIQTGIRYAVRHGSAVITMDADGQHEPAYLPELIGCAAGRRRHRRVLEPRQPHAPHRVVVLPLPHRLHLRRPDLDSAITTWRLPPPAAGRRLC